MRNLKKILSFTIVMLIFISNIAYGAVPYYFTQNSVYRITETITLKNNGSSSYNLVYNIGSNSVSNYQQEVGLKIYGNGAKLTVNNGIKVLTANGNFYDEIKYTIIRTVQTQNIKYNVDLSKTSGNYSKFKEYQLYTKPDVKIESNNRIIKQVAATIFKGVTNPEQKATIAYGFVNTYLKYDDAYGNKGAYSALINKKGVCEDYSELFVALLRASGVPARIVGGFWVDKDKSGNVVGSTRHAWAEYYLPEYGWVPVEPTNIYYTDGKKKIDWNYFSQLPTNDHIITGYNVNNSIDGTATVRYYGSPVKLYQDVKIEKIK